MECSCVD
ncbi:hypothetical protein CP8484711_0689, partial [Chlamydia psittaci 84-8471/1]